MAAKPDYLDSIYYYIKHVRISVRDQCDEKTNNTDDQNLFCEKVAIQENSQIDPSSAWKSSINKALCLHPDLKEQDFGPTVAPIKTDFQGHAQKQQ
jgi:hypothetical protein